MTEQLRTELVAECERQFENCRDTAVSFIMWLKTLRLMRLFFVVAPIVFGALATWKVLADAPIPAAVFTLLATVLPPVYRATKLDDLIKDYETLTGEFTNLRDRFRQASNITSHKSLDQFEVEVQSLMTRIDKARSRAMAPPNHYFRKARKSIVAGNYLHDRDVPTDTGKIEDSKG
ncbi:MAG TPA: hypothetical protein VIQ05_15955 [Tardiphaga sp.]